MRLEPDVAAIFPSADAVNEALIFLIRVPQQNQSTTVTTLPKTQEGRSCGVDLYGLWL